jgi:hypothetical protein
MTPAGADGVTDRLGSLAGRVEIYLFRRGFLLGLVDKSEADKINALWAVIIW